MRMQCVPGLPSPSPQRPGDEASALVAQRDPTSACARTMAMGFFSCEVWPQSYMLV